MPLQPTPQKAPPSLDLMHLAAAPTTLWQLALSWQGLHKSAKLDSHILALPPPLLLSSVQEKPSGQSLVQGRAQRAPLGVSRQNSLWQSLLALQGHPSGAGRDPQTIGPSGATSVPTSSAASVCAASPVSAALSSTASAPDSASAGATSGVPHATPYAPTQASAASRANFDGGFGEFMRESCGKGNGTASSLSSPAAASQSTRNYMPGSKVPSAAANCVSTA